VARTLQEVFLEAVGAGVGVTRMIDLVPIIAGDKSDSLTSGAHVCVNFFMSFVIT
jgi:hypothetical protein